MKKRIASLFLFVFAGLFLTGCLTTQQGQQMVSVEDQAIANDVYSRLSADPDINPGSLGITVNNKIVTLMGVVDSQQEKARAVIIARGTPGIGGVIDKLSYQNFR